MKRVLIPLVLLLALLGACADTGSTAEGVTVGSKQYTESIVLGELYAQLIEAQTDIPVTRKLNLGGTSVCVPAMENGEIDLYFEFGGTAFGEIFAQSYTGESMQEIHDYCKENFAADYNFTFFDPLAFNNTYALAMTEEEATELGVTKLSDLSPIAGDLRFGCGHIFYSRANDGYEGVTATYDLAFAEALTMDTTLLYDAIDQDQLDTIVVFTTDSFLQKYNLVTLEDDKSIFPPYQGAPVLRTETLEAYPELGEALNLLAGQLTTEEMRNMNYQVDVEHRSAEEVAAEFLQSKGLA